MKIFEGTIQVRCNEPCKKEIGPDCINCDKGKVYIVEKGNITAELKRGAPKKAKAKK